MFSIYIVFVPVKLSQPSLMFVAGKACQGQTLYLIPAVKCFITFAQVHRADGLLLEHDHQRALLRASIVREQVRHLH